MPCSSTSCHQVLEKQPQSAPPPPTCRRPPPFRHGGPQHLPAPHSGHIASGQRHSPGSRNSPRLEHRLTHWRTLMKPSGSSSRRQRNPTSRRSTCGDRVGGGSGRRGTRESAGPPRTHTRERGRNRGPARHPGGEGAVRQPQGRAGSTCWRGDLSAARLGPSVEDMLAQRGRGAAPGLGSLAGKLRAPRTGWGLLSGWGSSERCGSAGGRRRPGLQAGGVGGGGAAAGARRGRDRRSAPPAAESPRVRFKLLSNSPAHLAAESRGVRSRALLPPPRPRVGPQGALKGPVAWAGSSAARGLRFLARSLRGQSQASHRSRSNSRPESELAGTPRFLVHLSLFVCLGSRSAPFFSSSTPQYPEPPGFS